MLKQVVTFSLALGSVPGENLREKLFSFFRTLVICSLKRPFNHNSSLIFLPAIGSMLVNFAIPFPYYNSQRRLTLKKKEEIGLIAELSYLDNVLRQCNSSLSRERTHKKLTSSLIRNDRASHAGPREEVKLVQSIQKHFTFNPTLFLEETDVFTKVYKWREFLSGYIVEGLEAH